MCATMNQTASKIVNKQNMRIKFTIHKAPRGVGGDYSYEFIRIYKITQRNKNYTNYIIKLFMIIINIIPLGS